MLSVDELLETTTVLAIGKLSDQVLATRPATGALPGIANWTSYSVPGVSITIEPRHSPLRESNHMFSPLLKVLSPAFLYWISQPAEPGLEGGVQYRPSDSNVATALVPVDGSDEVAVVLVPVEVVPVVPV